MAVVSNCEILQRHTTSFYLGVNHGRKNFFQGGGSRGLSQNFFQGEPKVVKFGFNPSKSKKQPFLLMISKSREGLAPPPPPSDARGVNLFLLPMHSSVSLFSIMSYVHNPCFVWSGHSIRSPCLAITVFSVGTKWKSTCIRVSQNCKLYFWSFQNLSDDAKVTVDFSCSLFMFRYFCKVKHFGIFLS